MDSEHRHELKSNELADLLTHFPDFLKRNAYTIIGITLIVIALVTWPLFSRMKQEKTITEEAQVASAIQMLGSDINTALQAYSAGPEQLNPALNAVLANAESLLEQSAETDNPNLAALAHIKAAQAIRTELHLRKDVVSEDTIRTQIGQAVQAYENAAQIAAIPTLKAMAQFGIGLSHEELGQMEQARQVYQAIADEAAYAATVFPQMAHLRLDTLADIKQRFTFVEAPPEEPAAEEAPMPGLNLEEGLPIEIPAPQTPVPPVTEPAVPQTDAGQPETGTPAEAPDAQAPAGETQTEP